MQEGGDKCKSGGKCKRGSKCKSGGKYKAGKYKGEDYKNFGRTFVNLCNKTMGNSKVFRK